MRLRARLTLYLAGLHASLLCLIIYHRDAFSWLLIPFEILLAISFLVGLHLVRLILEPARAASFLLEAIRAGDLGARYPATGHKEIDAIVESYNAMLASLHKEWLKLGEQRGFLEQFLAVTPIGIIILDFEHRISLVNRSACRVLGVSADALLGKDLHSLTLPSSNLIAALASDEARLISDSQGRRLVCRRGRFEDRGFMRTYLIVEELTSELDRTEREMFEKLVRMISHEVTNTVAATNSLLDSCRTYSQQIQNAGDKNDYLSALDVVITRNKNLNQFIGGFAEIVRLASLNREPTPVHELLSAMRTMFRAEFEHRHISVELRVQENLPLISIDRNQMDRVMINVIKNAIEAVGHDGHIEFTAGLVDDLVSISIIDSGVGLQSGTVDRLFAPFYTTKPEGQGLGLMLVKQILVEHGFDFSLRAIDGRTHFTIRVPVVGSELSGQTGAQSSHPAEKGVRVPSHVVPE